MSKRLQVVLEDSEYRDLEHWARRQRTSVSAVVRRAIREFRQSEATREPQRKLQVVREAARHAYPAPEIAQVLTEIERGYGGVKEQWAEAAAEMRAAEDDQLIIPERANRFDREEWDWPRR